MRWIFAAVLWLSGCSATVLQSTPNTVLVEHLQNRPETSDAIRKATAECAKYGKVAVLDKQSCPAQCLSQFRCE